MLLCQALSRTKAKHSRRDRWNQFFPIEDIGSFKYESKMTRPSWIPQPRSQRRLVGHIANLYKCIHIFASQVAATLEVVMLDISGSHNLMPSRNDAQHWNMNAICMELIRLHANSRKPWLRYGDEMFVCNARSFQVGLTNKCSCAKTCENEALSSGWQLPISRWDAPCCESLSNSEDLEMQCKHRHDKVWVKHMYDSPHPQEDILKAILPTSAIPKDTH